MSGRRVLARVEAEADVAFSPWTVKKKIGDESESACESPGRDRSESESFFETSALPNRSRIEEILDFVEKSFVRSTLGGLGEDQGRGLVGRIACILEPEEGNGSSGAAIFLSSGEFSVKDSGTGVTFQVVGLRNALFGYGRSSNVSVGI